MPTPNAFPLGHDVADTILHHIDDAATLFSFILSSKAVFGVYKDHSMSILRSVAAYQAIVALGIKAHMMIYGAKEGVIDVKELWMTIPAHQRSKPEEYDFETYFSCRRRRMDESMIRELRACQTLQTSQDAPGYSWAEDDSLCEQCLKRCITERIVPWWSRQRLEVTKDKRPNCRHGWGCKSNVDDEDHACAFNHFCEPTPDN
ncbi:hypothetical protein PUNSTDRAFT_131674 [Punctularia strigosozonata HHB-11173 SS5]|uniref:uncharacterized protein n=1 Tax=Punctularia strigosozonata (strain HHB-11173) TaxID=741275 RepID=UPI0004417016|nr:uncharacterized protein PUNSTDRAFT_131674 [Punctularia strigosozonata HHB-11173 SS5]EIN11509.1 hypothetical protein PUNSTDRAFT_131674 [Punctularia strigosozonata HHB-11173 SS5]